MFIVCEPFSNSFFVTFARLWTWCYLFNFFLPLAAALSAEEDRLWNIVRANSLDFSAWTSLIEETEKVAEVCLLTWITFLGCATIFIFQMHSWGDWVIFCIWCYHVWNCFLNVYGGRVGSQILVKYLFLYLLDIFFTQHCITCNVIQTSILTRLAVNK